MPDHFYVLLILLLPLLGFLVLGLLGSRYLEKAAGAMATAILLLVSGIALYTAWDYYAHTGKIEGVYRPLVVFKYAWLSFSPQVTIDMGVLLDPAAAMMITVISFISLMVHCFSLGYMKGESRPATYYAFLLLFTFSMLGLVLSSNIFQLYFFWELVGVSSYLLIGFYFDRPAAVAAAKKAFIVTRFADLGLLVGILILAFYGETLDFGLLINRLTHASSHWSVAITGASFMGISALTWALVLVFAGGAGKSAMFPLHIWLPDAMEGPTPVSALIHAATMVVAGVYLVARLFPIFSFNGLSLQLVTVTGAGSALIAAVMACVQTDIKRILAYSTMSQIGYMMFSLGIARYGGEHGLGYTASLFHLFTHAFFKCLLFLGAGAVIHSVHSNDITAMGALRKYLPVTHACFLIACLAIAGIPPFAGFFSKEEILTAAFQSGKLIYALGLLVSGLTAFYMFRLYFSVFWNKALAPHAVREKNGISMNLPLLVLAAAAVLAGFTPFSAYITADGVPLQTGISLVFSIAPVLLALAGIGLAGWLYKTQNNKPAQMAAAGQFLYRVVSQKFYVDECYLFITKKIIFPGIGRPAAWIDKHIIDGFMNGIAAATAAASRWIKRIQSGNVQGYGLYFFAGVAVLAVMVIYVWSIK